MSVYSVWLNYTGYLFHDGKYTRDECPCWHAEAPDGTRLAASVSLADAKQACQAREEKPIEWEDVTKAVGMWHGKSPNTFTQFVSREDKP